MRLVFAACATVVIATLTLSVATTLSLRFAPDLSRVIAPVARARLLSRDATPITITYQNRWNVHDRLTLAEVPVFLLQAMVQSEDRHFFEHRGVDWPARIHALWQNFSAMRRVRGASTITEQVVRLVHPRPRTLWSRWLEGFEASRLEAKASKNEILEFYLNQVPYAANRRGIAQAARHYFNRSVQTLSPKESLALAVLVRAPSRLDLWKDARAADERIRRLAQSMQASGRLSSERLSQLRSTGLALEASRLTVDASHFARHVYAHLHRHDGDTVQTTLDPTLQAFVQALLDERLTQLAPRNVNNAAALVVDHRRNQILAWNVGAQGSSATPGRHIDAVTTPRQPGSTLKPFVYAMALEQGWTAATLIDDAPLAESVGTGLHRYRNYSRQHYGPLTLRDALGNSLNIPAVKVLQRVGTEAFLQRLSELGISSLTQHPDRYGDGLALGNGEISLYELVQAYTVLARQGQFKPLEFRLQATAKETRHVYSEEASSLIGHILSDPSARTLEFGQGSVLNLPVQTAVKTGTSTDYRDSWAIGFNHRYTVGVWMGNLDRTATAGITGSRGPAFILRSVFARLSRRGDTRPLYLSPRLASHEVCAPSGLSDTCHQRTEWFIRGTEPVAEFPAAGFTQVFVRHPSNGLQLALDPRIPDALEAFRLTLSGKPEDYRGVEWLLDEERLPGNEATFLWTPTRGRHTLRARVWRDHGTRPIETAQVSFEVR